MSIQPQNIYIIDWYRYLQGMVKVLTLIDTCNIYRVGIQQSAGIILVMVSYGCFDMV